MSLTLPFYLLSLLLFSLYKPSGYFPFSLSFNAISRITNDTNTQQRNDEILVVCLHFIRLRFWNNSQYQVDHFHHVYCWAAVEVVINRLYIAESVLRFVRSHGISVAHLLILLLRNHSNIVRRRSGSTWTVWIMNHILFTSPFFTQTYISLFSLMKPPLRCEWRINTHKFVRHAFKTNYSWDESRRRKETWND